MITTERSAKEINIEKDDSTVSFSELGLGTFFRMCFGAAILIKVNDRTHPELANVWNYSNNTMQFITPETKIYRREIVKRVECTFYF